MELSWMEASTKVSKTAALSMDVGMAKRTEIGSVLNSRNDSAPFQKQITQRWEQETKSRRTACRGALSGCARGPGSCGQHQHAEPNGTQSPMARRAQGSSTRSAHRSQGGWRRHAAPRSPHSEVAFMWKAGAPQQAAKRGACRMG